MPQKTDQELKEALQRALDEDINLRSYALKGDVIEKEAQLQGIVDSLAEKEHAERIAKNIPGIKSIANGITISTDGNIVDKDVEFEVAEELNADPNVNLKNIGVKSSGGVVTLVGNTDNPQEIKAAKKAAMKAKGVTKVVSQVKKKKPEELSEEEIFHSQVNNDRDSLH